MKYPNKNPEKMDNDKIVKVYKDLHRMHKNENNPQIALKIAERKQELWEYAKNNGFAKELL